MNLDLPVSDEREHQSHQRQTPAENDDEALHAVLIEGRGDPRGNTISYSATGLWKTVDRTGVQGFHVGVMSASARQGTESNYKPSNYNPNVNRERNVKGIEGSGVIL